MQSDDLLALIQGRRTCYQFLNKKVHPVAELEIQQCLQAAIAAPNHKLTEPWLFWVLGKEHQHQLASIYAENRAHKKSQHDPVLYQHLFDKAIDKFLGIPQIILVGQKLDEDPVVAKEDYAACSCAIQNFQLMAWSLDIGVQWSTGPILKDKRTYDALNIDADEIELVGALYLGHVDDDSKPRQGLKRKPLAEVVHHLS